MQVLHTADQLRAWRQQTAARIAFVPTMGALHEGHMELIHVARRLGQQLVVSIFVNPTQFAPHEDYEQYPRPLEQDLDRCRQAGVDLVFQPGVKELYPSEAPAAEIDVPALSTILEGAHRPGHFAGVCRVVAKLLNLIQPHEACFGQKDYQQLKIVEAMVDDLLIPTRIVAVPTVREQDGLAMSSRNQYLDPEQRRHAVGLYKALQQARAMIEDDGETDPQNVEHAMNETIEAHQIAPDYALVRHPHSLREIDCIEPALTHGVALLAAGWLGQTRLIDNMIVGT